MANIGREALPKLRDLIAVGLTRHIVVHHLVLELSGTRP